jgi:hypothetical protein
MTERQPQEHKQEYMRRFIEADTQLKASLYVIKDLLEKEAASASPAHSADKLWYVMLEEGRNIKGRGMGWAEKHEDSQAEAGVVITIPDSKAHITKRLADNDVIHIGVFMRAQDLDTRLEIQKGYEEGISCYPGDLASDPNLQQQLREQIKNGLPQALADMQKAPELLDQEAERRIKTKNKF